MSTLGKITVTLLSLVGWLCIWFLIAVVGSGCGISGNSKAADLRLYNSVVEGEATAASLTRMYGLPDGVSHASTEIPGSEVWMYWTLKDGRLQQVNYYLLDGFVVRKKIYPGGRSGRNGHSYQRVPQPGQVKQQS